MVLPIFRSRSVDTVTKVKLRKPASSDREKPCILSVFCWLTRPSVLKGLGHYGKTE